MSLCQRPYTFLVENHVFSSPNSSTIPPIPPRGTIGSDLRDVRNTRWADPRYPGLPFIPLSPRFDSGPFSCLGPPRQVFPINGSESSWQLAPATVKSFKILENDLHLIERALRKPHKAGLLSLSSSYRLFPSPKTYGYSKVHKSREAAQASAAKSRDAFLVLMGLCSFFLSGFHGAIQQPGIGISRWESILQENKFSLDYIQVIKASELNDFSINYPRAGVFIDHLDPYFQHYVTAYTKYNVPVWIYWGNVNAGRPNHTGVLLQYLPSDAEVANVRAAAGRPQVTATQSPPSLVNKHPEPEKGSGQGRGELWKDFFSRMEKSREKAIQREDSRAKTVRLSREAAQKAHPPPGLGSKAPRVYEWEEDVSTGFLLRKPVSRSYAQDIWSNYSKTQRRYNSVRNEWDLCTALDPGAIGTDDSDSDDDWYFTGSTRTPVPQLPSVNPVAREAILSPTARKSSPPAIPPPPPPTGHSDIPSPPHLITALVHHNLISAATVRESTSHPTVPLPPSNHHDANPSDLSCPPALPHAPSAHHESWKNHGIMSPSVLPSLAKFSQAHTLPVCPSELVTPPPAISSPTSAANTQLSTVQSSPTAISPSHHLVLSAAGCELAALPLSIQLSPSAAQNEGPTAYARVADVEAAEMEQHASYVSTQQETLGEKATADTQLADGGPVELEQDVSEVPTHKEGAVADSQMADGETVEAFGMEEATPGVPTEPEEIREEGAMVDIQMTDRRVETAREAPGIPIEEDGAAAEMEVVGVGVENGAPDVPTDLGEMHEDGAMSSAQITDGGSVETEEDDPDVSMGPGVMHGLVYDDLAAPLLPLSFTGTLADDVYERYGFIGDASSGTLMKWSDVRNILGDANHSEDKTWSTVRKTFGDVESPADHGLQVPLTYFLAGLLQPVKNPLQQLASLWDLAIGSAMPLEEHINPSIRLVVQTDGPTNHYLIKPKTRGGVDVNWQIMLSDPATVLECFRREDASSIHDIALFLLQHGRPFSTRSRRDQLRLTILGWRPAGHRPTISEYNFYEHLRSDFFTKHPRSRAARLKGAIIWRLAIEGDGGLVDERVLEGPSEEALMCGTCLGLVDGVGSLWDDELSEADMDLICGVYKYSTGGAVKSITPMVYSPAFLGNRNQTSDLSWWPKQSTFLKSGLWAGYWSRSCEDWFLRRNADIASGNADLKTSGQWYKSLTLYQKVAKLREVNRKAAELYIQHHGNLFQ